jgi:hypothetical protein
MILLHRSIGRLERYKMGNRLSKAMEFDREELQAGIDEAEDESQELLERVALLEAQIKKGRQLLEGGTADLTSGEAGQRLTLHEAIRQVLRTRGNEPATARELADEIHRRDLYRKRDGSPVEINQIHARVNNYGSMFEKVENKIRLKEE